MDTLYIYVETGYIVQIKFFIVSLYYTKACKEFCGPHLCVIAPWQLSCDLSKKNRSGGKPLATLCILTSTRFEPQSSCYRNELVTARPTGRLHC